MNSNIKLGIVMDPLSSINLKKDSSIAMLAEAQKRKYTIYYMEIKNLYSRKNDSRAYVRKLKINKKLTEWFILEKEKDISLSELDVILMRKDPPLNIEFIYATYILENAEKQGVLIINKPQSLRDCNEKIFTSYFKDLIPDTLVSSNFLQICEFLYQHKDIILKPLNNMGGTSVFRLKINDSNKSVIIDHLTNYGNVHCMAQNYLPDIKKGDKRILIIDGKPVPYCLARIPKNGENRGNLAVGGKGIVQKLSISDKNIVNKIKNELKKRGLIFVGIDVIGNKLTEINITSPTCIKEIENFVPKLNISKILIDVIEKKLA